MSSRKRKASLENKNVKKCENNCSSKDKWDLHLKTPQDVFQFLINPFSAEEFFKTYWEEQPLIQHGRKYTEKFWTGLFTKEMVFDLVKNNDIWYKRDVSTSKYKSGKRINLDSRGGQLKESHLQKLFDSQKGTLQLHQPQRWVDELWKIMERLECFFGCLVGANVYITPVGSQGLAPHYDDVEVFIVQLEGEKTWKLYKPPVILPRTYSEDLSEKEIGKPTHEFTLKPGDLLYMPRGTVHQAFTPESSSSHSTHITISTYQKHTVGDYLSSVLPKLLESAVNSQVELRKGMPLHFYPECKISWETLKPALESLVNCRSSEQPPLPDKDLIDFMLSRLPPYGTCPEDLDSTPGQLPTENSKLRLINRDHFAYYISEKEGQEGLFVYSSRFNDRTTHMMFSSDKSDMESNIGYLPVNYLPAVKQLHEADGFIPVKKLTLSAKERQNLVMTLFCLHIIECKND